VHHIRPLLLGDEAARLVFGQAGLHGSQDLGVLSGGIEILQLRSKAGALVGGGAIIDGFSLRYPRQFSLARLKISSTL